MIKFNLIISDQQLLIKNNNIKVKKRNMISIKLNKTDSSLDNYLNENSTDLLVLGVFLNENTNLNGLNSNDSKKIKKAISDDKFKGGKNERLFLYGDKNAKRLVVFGLGDKSKITSEQMRAQGANIYNYANSRKISKISISLKSFKRYNGDTLQPLMEGIFLGSYSFNEHKNPKDKKIFTKTLDLIDEKIGDSVFKNAVTSSVALSESVSLARDLGNQPANLCTPTYLAETAIKIAKSKNMKSEIFDVKEFEKMNLGSFYGVARGAKEPAKLILVEYTGGKKEEAPIGLVGKGLTFDTGGISLKPPAKMDEMKFDMCGSATVLGVMKAVSILQPKVNIVFAIGSTENMPGSDAQRPGDIVTAHNGKTIEVLNTDAEGRLVLADVLSYVNEKYSPQCMIDFATLTGAVIVALGHRATGLMGNNKDLVAEIQKSSEETGEKVWELPLWDEYSDDIKGTYADIKNIGSGGAGTITAGAFLKEFVGDTPWCHLDIAGTAWGVKPTGYNPKFGATGVAVRLIYDFLENKIK